MPVATVAKAMLVDALDFRMKKSTGAEEEEREAASNVAVFKNADIHGLCEVSLDLI